MDQGFPAASRFHDKRDYGRAFHRGVRVHGQHCMLVLAPRPKRAARRARLGVVVSTKVHKRAVHRHRCKRWVRELFRRDWKERLHGIDCVVVFKNAPELGAHADLDAELQRSLDKALARLAG
ncbi:MAG: ribonuclease P protein component [Planctomycetota bacterium]|jgi:ribonuclease P protein component|nr:ribonuclease P protein component [Planctomycetota bacterium]